MIWFAIVLLAFGWVLLILAIGGQGVKIKHLEKRVEVWESALLELQEPENVEDRLQSWRGLDALSRTFDMDKRH